MFLAITIIVIITALCTKAILRLRRLEKFFSEIYCGVTPYVVANHKQMDKLHKQLVAAANGNKLPLDTILPFRGDDEVYSLLWGKRDLDNETDEVE